MHKYYLTGVSFLTIFPLIIYKNKKYDSKNSEELINFTWVNLR